MVGMNRLEHVVLITQTRSTFSSLLFIVGFEVKTMESAGHQRFEIENEENCKIKTDSFAKSTEKMLKKNNNI